MPDGVQQQFHEDDLSGKMLNEPDEEDRDNYGLRQSVKDLRGSSQMMIGNSYTAINSLRSSSKQQLHQPSVEEVFQSQHSLTSDRLDESAVLQA